MLTALLDVEGKLCNGDVNLLLNLLGSWLLKKRVIGFDPATFGPGSFSINRLN
jgi:hypothetical protein